MAIQHAFRPDFKRGYLLLGALVLLGFVLSLCLMFFLSMELFSFLPGAAALAASIPIALYYKLIEMTYIYHINDEEIAVEQGILNKKTRSVPVANVDNITIERSILDRLLGVGSICIDTPGGTGYELVLRHVGVNLLNEITGELKNHMKKQREIGVMHTPNQRPWQGNP